ncbi:hypothetical protein LOZ53_006737 [Ophidiomyces ophidiicola]|uniref:Uncharacterized protein n=1 Tax=Ophidiomyces ophidiicola TaxID=1387563 RepID=A0ACB8V077_9EURO|nr:hypothetical protein LOZ64_006085 [Ophidiomyces ophidiicola]KAI1910079.1 hypothetical protein LOZ61_004597 [Ophidiomyces ophidiicola]KAI1920079.1 hypothetical protein LOZ60_006699 [Ophidiomyces ophidiicola]KAI1939709.1 hypothetical protein LOZ62_005010 [Ophidiomyces ophidiicola]KAI1946208.1 hypothetical protein LOZ59_006823 [Ophidiomyces ophidiicola]
MQIGPNTNTEVAARPPLSFMRLPIDLHVYLLSYLNYRDLQMLRATNTYFRYLVSETELRRSKAAYVKIIYWKEVEEALREHMRRLKCEAFGTIPANPPERLYLTCYTCLRLLPTEEFADTQVTRRRTWGHTNAWKRFCTECAIRHNRWKPGTFLGFQGGEKLYCRGCHVIKPSPVGEIARSLGLCQDCADNTSISTLFADLRGDWYEKKTICDQLLAQYEHPGRTLSKNDWDALSRDVANLKLSQ